ncbi:S46 family peptidase [Crocinitomicaceae bacterium]|nr:S46 family peptidase [Crocinitomicaceae bacterium]
MMKQFFQKATFTVAILITTIFTSLAEEGMIIPSLIAAFEDDMKAMGMQLSADEIYSVNNSSLKDAILHFGGGCTAELVSGEGLLLTNHHCGFSQVQSHSSVENDYLKNGFWAKTRAEELRNPGLFVDRVVRIQDVSETVFFGTKGLTDQEKAMKMQENIDQLEADAMEGNNFSAEIKAFNYGNDYYMIVKERFNDVRLVGAPPSSIGKFGGDTDNWVWPRHTGDFSVFRVYANAQNQPADISDSNVPYKPLHFLPVSMKSRKDGDFTMIYGFPGKTEQHLCSEQLRYIMDEMRPQQIKMRDLSLGVINASMSSTDALRIMYASKQARIANAWKKWIGQLGGLKTVDAMQIKLDREAAYVKKANSMAEWKDKYATVIDDMNALAKANGKYDVAYNMFIEYGYVGAEVFKQTRSMEEFVADLMKVENEGAFDELVEKKRKSVEGFFKNYDPMTDRKVFMKLTAEYIKSMGDDVPEMLKNMSVEDLTAAIYDNSVLTDKERFMEFLDDFSYGKLAKYKKKVAKNEAKPEGKRKEMAPFIEDDALAIWDEFLMYFRSETLPGVREYFGGMNSLLQVYVAGRKEMFPDENMWPDANSTMRITYGKLEGSAPHDGMMYTPYTTLDGIIAKNNTGNPDFDVLPRLRELAEAKDYGQYAQDGELWVCFTGSNHTTGGNSGSPALDAEGNLIGINFDRTWESTMSDYMFDTNRCRNIMVDIRYVMWVMDVYAGAGHLVEEMTLEK